MGFNLFASRRGFPARYITWTGAVFAETSDEGALGNWGSSQSGQSSSRTGNIMSGGVIRQGGAAAGGHGSGAAAASTSSTSSGFAAFQGSGQSLGRGDGGGGQSWGGSGGEGEGVGMPVGQPSGLGRLLGGVVGGGGAGGEYTQVPLGETAEGMMGGQGGRGQVLGGGDEDDKVQQIVDMGFESHAARTALRATGGNVEEAVVTLST